MARLGLIVGVGILGMLPSALVRAGDPAPAAPKPSPLASALSLPGREAVRIPVAEKVMLAGTYAANGATSGSPAVLLVHGEGANRVDFVPLLDALDEHRVPWLAIDLRGHGESRVQDGTDLGPAMQGLEEASVATLPEDVWGSLRWLAEVKGHDPKRLGVLASGLGASAAAAAARQHKGGVMSLMLMTPAMTYPGLDTAADVADQDGTMDFWFLASVEDMNRLAKKGPRHLLYIVERARNAPPDTPLEERILKRRGIPPHLRAFAEKGATGPHMVTAVPHLDGWLAGWWGRRLGTMPHDVLYDGSVDVKGDYADTEWQSGAALPSGPLPTARALRWGNRVMVGGELPVDVRSIVVRIRASRDGSHGSGQVATIAFPAGTIFAERLTRGLMGRSEPIETTALVLEPEEIPQRDGPLEYGKPSFEVEFRIPRVHGDGPLEVVVSWGVDRGGEVVEQDLTVDPAEPKSWTVVPDQLDPATIAADKAAAEKAAADKAAGKGQDPKKPGKPKGEVK